MMIEIDPELKNIIPSISEDERKGLEQSLIEDGCRDPLVIWDGLLIDGHSRYEICQEHNIKYQTIKKIFDSKDEAKIWIIKNQLSRRNLSPDQASYLRGKRYELEKKEEGGRADRDFSGDQNEHLKTAEKVARETGVSPATVRRDAKFAKAVDQLPPEEKQKMLSGRSSKSKKEILGSAGHVTPKAQDLPEETPEPSPPKMAPYLVTVTIEARNINQVRKAVGKAFPNMGAHVEKVDMNPSRGHRLSKAESLVKEAKGIISELRKEIESCYENLAENLSENHRDQLAFCNETLQAIERTMDDLDFSSVQFPPKMG